MTIVCRVFILSLVLLLPGISEAARLFTCGLEEGTPATPSFTTTMWSSTIGAPTITTSNVHSGLNALRLNPTSAGWAVARNLSANKTTGTLWSSYTFRPAGIPSSTTDITRVRSSAPANVWGLQLLSSGKLRLTNYANGSTTFDSTAVLSAGTTYRIEVGHVLQTTATGTIEVKLFVGDSTTTTDDFGDIAGTSITLLTNVLQYNFGQFTTTVTSDFNFDDIRINDETGATQNTWLGPGSLELTIPASNGTVTWTKGGSSPAATNWQGVSEVPANAPDDGVTLNCDPAACAASATTNEDKLGISALSANVPSNATMVLLDLYGRVNVATAVSGTMAFVVWDDASTRTQGPTITVNATAWRIVSTAEHQVQNLTGASKSQVNSYSIGYKALTGTVAKQVTALWGSVEWVASSIGPRNNLIGVVRQ